MAEATVKPIRKCIYCGNDVVRERRGEHILPEAIGGELTVKEVSGKGVCTRCNTGILSHIDKELSSRSYLSVIASQELSSDIWQVWDIDHASRNTLVEARPVWEDGELRSLVCYPQLTFEPRGPDMRGDAEEMLRFGREDFEKVLYKAVHGAFQRFQAGKRGGLHLERVRTDFRASGYRLPPRVYTTHTITEIAENVRDQSFILRFLTAEDLRLALWSLSKLDVEQKSRYNQWGQTMGSRVPTISVYFDLGLTMRALMKIGVNLLASYCSKTAVNCDTFRAVTRLILGRTHPQPLHIASNGFVHAEDVEELARPGCHSFRITYLNGEWVIYSCFFGGRIGSVVSFPGPNREDWNTMEVVAPIRSRDWTVTTSQLYQPLRVRIEWKDSTKITPTLKMQYGNSQLVVEQIPARHS